MFSIQEEVILNQYAQGIKLESELLEWYNSYDIEKKRSILIEIWSLANQARVTKEDVENARITAGLKTTHTPVRILYSEKLPLKNRGYKLADLKGKEQVQAFLLILNCFAIAEQRRKSKCDANKKNCNHWWHQDLSNAQLIQEILKNQP